MAIRMYLTDAATKEWLKESQALKEWEQNRYQGERPQTTLVSKFTAGCENGAWFIVLVGDLMDPIFIEPKIEAGNIEFVTFMDSYYGGHRPEGLYEHERATARVETQSGTKWQHISIKAPTLDAAKEIYTKVRNCDLQPTTKWHLHSVDPRLKPPSSDAPAASGGPDTNVAGA
jgi:hypothetical protein